jgi:3-(methylsulfanyl)propanoyl-CoA dehydrogenase
VPTYRAPLAEFRFVLDDVLELDHYAELPGFGELSPDVSSDLLEGAAKFCEERLLPLNRAGDVEGCRFENGVVLTPRGFKEAYRDYVAGGWPTLSFDPAFGGQGLPRVMSTAVSEMLVSANMAFSGYIDITQGACELLRAHGSPRQQALYLPNLVSGCWSGAMHLTEPQAGTDVGLIGTHAQPMPDGSYRLRGAKILITGVDHDMSENVINLVLARIAGAPAGIRGISLFIVPKFLVHDDGSLGKRNSIYVSGVEHKMGVRASATCAVTYEDAVGYLVGEPGQGLQAMFVMMNDTRLGVGVQGLGISEVAYQNALAYARERLQGRSPSGPQAPDQHADPIIVHPDVRRMLLTIKAFTEAARALALWTALHIDLSRHHPEAAERQRADDLVALLTPVIKAHFTDCASENANFALQCFGGHGYICESGIEQFVRDIRVAQIYEGTNGVQGLDLAGRKITLHGGRLADTFFDLLEARAADVRAVAPLQDYARALDVCVAELREATAWMRERSVHDRQAVAAGATEYLRLFGVAALTWTWAGIACTAQRKLGEQSGEARFYRDKLATGRFYLARAIPEARMLAARACRGAEPLYAVDL